jgi:hypothetical protein
MFDPDKAKDIKPGESVADVNHERLDVRPREVLPQERDRYAVGARVNHRFANGTLRADERLYTDTWGIKASTTDARYMHDLGERLRVWPHLRFNVQSKADFYHLAYPAIVDQGGVVIDMLPFRSGDRELSPMLTITAGGGSRIALTPDKAETKYAIIVNGEVMWSKFFQSLFVTSRTAIYGSVGFEVEL